MTDEKITAAVKRSWVGEWWLPEKPEKKVRGQLTWDPKDGASLVLSGSLTAADPNWTPRDHDDVFFSSSECGDGAPDRHIPMIWGKTDYTGELMSLINCFMTDRARGFKQAGWVRTSVEPLCILIGKHFSALDDVAAPCFCVELSCLQEWVNQSFQPGPSESTAEQESSSSRAHLPSDIVVNSEHNPMTIVFSVSQGGDPFAIDIRQSTTACFSSAAGISLARALNLVRNLTDLLTFVSRKQAGVTKAEFCATPDNLFSEGRVEVLHNDFAIVEQPAEARVYEMMFNLGDHQDSAATIWDGWCRLEERHRPLLHSYLGNLVHRSPYPFHQILDLSRAAESYHRRTFASKGRKLWQILHDLAEKQPASVKGLIGGLEAFSKSCANTRHYYAHYDREYAGNVEQEILLALRLQILLTSIILRELGFSSEQIDAIAKDYHRGRAFRLPESIYHVSATAPSEKPRRSPKS